MSKKYPPGPQDWMLGSRTMRWMKSDVLGAYAELQQKYGDSVSFRTGPYRLFVFYHPQQVRDVLVTHAKSFVRLPRVMATFSQWNGNSILIAEGKQWAAQRRLVQPAFQPRRMENYGRLMVERADRLVDSWDFDGTASDAAARVRHVDVDIDREMTGLTLDIICRALFDSDVAEDTEQIRRAVAILSEVAFYEMQAPIRLPAWLPTAGNRRKRWAMQLLDDTIWRIIRERRQEGADHGDLLSMLLAHVDQDEGDRLSDKQVRDEVATLMLAGHDTSAAGLDWVWYQLARHPEIAARCRAEIETVAAGRDLAAGDVARLPFLEATIKESLRLFPPAIGIFLRQATRDLEIGGFDVPRGALVTLSSYVTHRDARWFPEPERFQPERFLKPPDEDTPGIPYFPFGAGPRVCIGQAFAMAEMVLVTGTMLRRCEVSLPPGEADPKPFVHMALRPAEPLHIRWESLAAAPAGSPRPADSSEPAQSTSSGPSV